MNPHKIQSAITILVAFLGAAIGDAQPLEFSEVSLLVRSHEPESSIIADASQRKLVRLLTKEQETRLRSQGASDSLIQSLRQSNLILSHAEAAAYEATRSTAARIPETRARTAFASNRPNVEIVNVAFGHPINLSYWGGPDYEFAFQPRDIVEVGRPEVEMITPAGTGTDYITYHGVRVPGWEPVDPEYTSITSHVYARPLSIDWYNPARIDDVPYLLYPIYAAGNVALYYIGPYGDSVLLAVVTRGRSN